MIIALVSDAIWPYFRGGKERRIHEISTRLQRAGHEVHIYTMQWWDGPKVIEQDGIYLHAVCKKHDLYVGERRSIKEGILFALACFKLLSARFDVVDVDHMPYFPLYTMRIVCWIKRRPMVATWHEVWSPTTWKTYMGGVLGPVAYGIERLAAQLPNGIVAVSPATARRLQYVYGLPESRITLAANGIDAEMIAAAKPARQKSDIIFVGRLIKHKNAAMVIEVAAQLVAEYPSLKCIIIGRGPEAANLARLAADLGVANNIVFIPHLPESSDVYGMMKASRIFVLPSAREGFGLVAVEANAAKLPVLTLDHPDNATTTLIAPGQNGNIFKDATELAEQIRTYMQTPKSRKGYHKHISRFNWDIATEQVIERYAA
jgi:glycosyltransferase involved in cell wall biosynthesis